MKKIKTLFKRMFDGHKIVGITPELTDEEFSWVLNGEGEATEKFDGACCTIFDGIFYKRYDAKKGKNPPEGAIECDAPDPVTGHHPYWVPVDKDKPENKWFIKAYEDLKEGKEVDIFDGTYEAVGPHFQGNPYGLSKDVLLLHGNKVLHLSDRSFEGIKLYLEKHAIEGIVFWKDGSPQCKIKRSDFGFKWPVAVNKNINTYRMK